MKRTLFLFLISLLFVGCSSSANDTVYVKATAEIKQRAAGYARLYKEAETEYSWGGQDPLRTIKIDCSGLVYRCYQYAVENTIYQMIELDMSAAYMAEHCYSTDKPEEGDLIFMGEENSDKVTHIAVFLKHQDDSIYFIDSTLKEAENINGVTERHYPKDSKKIKSFGIMKLKVAK